MYHDKKNNKEILSKLVIDNIIEEKNKNEITFICEKSNKESKTDEANNKIDNEDEKTNENIEVLNQKIILSIKEITKDILNKLTFSDRLLFLFQAQKYLSL